MTNQPLALRGDAPTVFGTRDEIQSIADRIRIMLPSAHLSDTQIRRDDRARLQKVLDESIYRAAQLSVFYRLVPGEDVHVIPFGDNWAVDMGIECWKKAADRYCAQHGITYHIHTEEMTEAELRQRRGKNFDPDDVGVVAYLWRSDKKDVYDIFGAKQSMSRACGIWAVKAKLVKGEWKADQIPTQRSKQDVAKRRAMKAVLKLEFSLDSLLAATPAEMRQNVQYLESDLRHEEMRRAVPNDRRPVIDEDGFIVIEATAPRNMASDVEFVVADEPDIDDEPVMDDEPLLREELAAVDVDYRAVFGHLQGNAKTFAEYTKSKHLNSDGKASDAQYRYLAGVIDTILDCPRSHNHVLGVLVGRAVDGANPPGKDLCSKLLDWLPAEKTDRETGEKIANPNYRKDYADCIVAIWYAVRGQLPLFDEEAAS